LIITETVLSFTRLFSFKKSPNPKCIWGRERTDFGQWSRKYTRNIKQPQLSRN